MPSRVFYVAFTGLNQNLSILCGWAQFDNILAMIRPTSSGTTPSTSTASTTNTSLNGGTLSNANSNEVKGNVAAKVSEVFLTASHAFQKLGDLTLQLSAMNSKPESEERSGSF